ncbi:MAG TPA: gamma-glutamyltransferase, partial [Acidobacteria bacterium]|nr:gamma-glutamyltransferase [Acidobacteriota bacterium]
MKRLSIVVVLLVAVAVVLVQAGNKPVRARNGMVVSQNAIASQVGIDALEEGGTAVDAAVATAFALAVTHPTAGNIGGGGFLVHRAASGDSIAYDFREVAPAGSSATMWFEDGEYSFER